jgi:hypothetical protein
MPTFDHANTPDRIRASYDSEGLDKIISIFTANSGDNSSLARANRASVVLKHNVSYENILSSITRQTFINTAGCDLSAIFYPFQTTKTYSGMPCFDREFPTTTSGVATPNGYALLPFRWEQSKSNKVYDMHRMPSGDAIPGIVSAETRYGNTDEFRDISNMRSVGMRVPMMAVGWGYDTAGIPVPSGGPTRFKGGYEYGWMVDPKDYVAAPIDFRYDRVRHVWTVGKSEFWAKLLAEDPVNPGRYTFKRVVPSGYTFTDQSPPVTVSGYYAIEVNDVGGLANKYVMLEFAGYTASTPAQAVYFFSAGGGEASGLPNAGEQYTGLYAVTQGVWGIDFQRLHGV